MQVRITKGANLTRKQRDTILEDPRTINLTGELSTRQTIEERKNRIARRRLGTTAAKRKNIVHLMTSITFLILIVSITIRVMSAPANAEETIEEWIQEIEQQEEVIQEDITKLIEKVQDQQEKVILKENWTSEMHTPSTHKTDEEIVAEAIKFLHKFEWVRYEAYWDYKQWSICYWTKSYEWETATKETCDHRIKERVQTELLRINRIADNLDWNKKVALISFFYNTWYKYNVLNYAARWDDKSVVYLISLYQNAWWKKLQGLVNRRAAEIKFYNKK